MYLQCFKLHFRSVVPNGGSWWALCVSAYAYLFAAPRFLLYFPVEQNGLESLRLPIFSPAFLPVTRKVWESPYSQNQASVCQALKWWRGQSVCGTWKGWYLKSYNFSNTSRQLKQFGIALETNLCVDLKNKSLVAGPILKTRTWCTAMKPIVCFCATHINQTLAWQWEHRFTFCPVCPPHGGKAPGPRLCDRVSEIGWSF